MKERRYICIDLKSFYASVECVERGLNPLTTKLVVADPERTKQTICLAITPAMKELGIKNRCRVFQIPPNVEYIMAEPRMQLYIDYSAEIYGIYLRYISKEDIHVYSIDEVFMDVTDYLGMYGMRAEELGNKIMQEVFDETGITATCGVGTNLYLAKVALDITAKHVKNNIGILDEEKYREELWNYRPLTDFWRVGEGTAKRLQSIGISTMGGIAKADEKMLYKMFGVDAELLIDHAWGRESTTIADIKNYRPKKNSISSGQVLPRDYSFEEGKLIIKEMADLLSLDLVEKKLITDSLVICVGYSGKYNMPHARGTGRLDTPSNSTKKMVLCALELYVKIVDKNIPIRRITVTCQNVTDELCRQYDFFTTPFEQEKERHLQEALISIKKKYGKNAVLKGMDLEEGGTTIIRNRQIGGHKS